MTFGKVIFGDNQFLGVNHSNQTKASELFEKYKNPEEIIDTIGIAYECGVRDFMFTTHERYEPVFEEIQRSNMFPGLYFSPCLPYAHKYWNKISERGLIGALSSTLLKINAGRIFPSVLGLPFGKFQSLVKVLLEIEILMCKGLLVRGIFLQNLAFDFLMSIEKLDFISIFNEVVSDKFHVIPGFITMNHSLAIATLCDKIGIDKPWICANYNIAGFRMHPSKVICESSFASGKSNNIAMSVMSSGISNPSESLDYVIKRLKKEEINSILFGSSNPDNIIKNINRISS